MRRDQTRLHALSQAPNRDDPACRCRCHVECVADEALALLAGTPGALVGGGLKLASSRHHMVPGHDPDVMKLYPAAAPGLENWIARLDVAPKV